MKKIAFIGVGRMGKPMVKNLVKLGFEVHIYARSVMKVYDVISNGARFFSTISDCLKDCSIIVTMLGLPKDIEEIYFATGGVLDSAAPGAQIIDMTTTSPKLTKMINEECKKRSLHFLDAPVSGGVTAAKNAKLTIMVGGSEKDFKNSLPLFRALGTNINYMGESGKGQQAKLANQIMIAGAIAGVCEGMAYAKSKGLEMSKFLRAVSTGGAGSKQLDTAAPKILDRDFEPGFSIRHFIKDMVLALDEANKESLDLDVLAVVMNNYRKLDEQGFGENGTQTLIKYYER